MYTVNRKHIFSYEPLGEVLIEKRICFFRRLEENKFSSFQLIWIILDFI